MVLSVALFEKSFVNVVTITYTTLVFAEILNVVSEVILFYFLTKKFPLTF